MEHHKDEGHEWQSSTSGSQGERRDSYGRRDERHFDHEYHQWRDEQARAMDRDYEDWRRHRFARDFSDWRSIRIAQAGLRTGSGGPQETHESHERELRGDRPPYEGGGADGRTEQAKH